jgi:hypothetical protein
MRAILAACCLVAACAPACAETLNPPTIKSGDTWVYRVTTEKSTTGWSQTRDETTVTRVTPSSIYYTLKASGSTQPPKELFAGLDWSRVRDVNGKETTVNRPLSFPLTVGKTWDLQYTEPHPNKNFRSEEWSIKYTVVGLETVEVPAGKYNALKIEAEGRWTADLEPAQTVTQGAQSNADGTSMSTQVQKIKERTVTGRTYKAFWYVPEVKRWVKSIEEYYGSGGVRNESYTGELESFKAD